MFYYLTKAVMAFLLNVILNLTLNSVHFDTLGAPQYYSAGK